MKDKDQRLIWESYEKAKKTPVVKPKFSTAELAKLAGTPKPTKIEVNKENHPKFAIAEEQGDSSHQEILQFIDQLKELMPQVDVNWQIANGNQTGVTPERANNPRSWDGLKDFLNDVWNDEEYAAEFGLRGANWEQRKATWSPNEQSLYSFFNDSHKAPGRSKGYTSDYVNRLIKVNAGLPDNLAKFYGELKLTDELKDMFKAQTNVRLYINPESEQIRARNKAVSDEINSGRD